MKNWILLLSLGAVVTEAQESLPATSPTSLPAAGPATIAATTTRAATTLSTTMAAVGTTNPTTSAAASQPGTTRDRFARVSPPARSVAAAKVMPKDFALLVSRSVFVHGRMPDPRNPGDTGPGVPPAPPRPEKALLFNGATDADGELVAFVEDTTAGRVLKLRVGDPVARGKVAGITLESFDYDSVGKVRRVTLGQNLDGEAGMATSRPTMAASAPASSGPPAAGGAPPTDILERLRLKRAQELGGK